MDMKKLIFAFFLFFTSLAAPIDSDVDQVEERATNASTCVKGAYIICTKGHTKGPTCNSLGTLATRIYKNIADSTIKISSYPSQDVNLDHAISVGTEHVTEYVKNHVAQCPNAKIMLLGYSEGAIITMNTICGTGKGSPGLSSEYTNNIVATIVYGDESRAPNQPYDKGTCKSSGGIDMRMYPQGCDKFSSTIASYCDKDDPFCCVGGLNGSSHDAYAAEYNKQATAFAVKKFDAFHN